MDRRVFREVVTVATLLAAPVAGGLAVGQEITLLNRAAVTVQKPRPQDDDSGLLDGLGDPDSALNRQQLRSRQFGHTPNRSVPHRGSWSSLPQGYRSDIIRRI